MTFYQARAFLKPIHDKALRIAVKTGDEWGPFRATTQIVKVTATDENYLQPILRWRIGMLPPLSGAIQ